MLEFLPQILADQLTISQPGGTDHTQQITMYWHPRTFRPSYGPERCLIIMGQHACINIKCRQVFFHIYYVKIKCRSDKIYFWLFSQLLNKTLYLKVNLHYASIVSHVRFIVIWSTNSTTIYLAGQKSAMVIMIHISFPCCNHR